MATEVSHDDFYARVERRINWLTPALGFIAALIAWRVVSWRAGAGVVIGTLLIWLHYFWLRKATAAVVRAALGSTAGAPNEASGEKPKNTSVLMIFLLLVGYALIAILAYVIVIFLRLPVPSVLGGLLALGAAAMAGSAYTVLFENY